jgi:hypothetical protein
MINYSSIPLKFISGLGLCFSTISLVLACFYFFMHITGNITVSGFTTIVMLMLLIGGILMFSFGLVGEYLSRIVSQQLLDREYYIRTRLELRRGCFPAGEQRKKGRRKRLILEKDQNETSST